MTAPQQPEDADGQVQPATPAYSTPPPEGLPSADDDEGDTAQT